MSFNVFNIRDVKVIMFISDTYIKFTSPRPPHWFIQIQGGGLRN